MYVCAEKVDVLSGLPSENLQQFIGTWTPSVGCPPLHPIQSTLTKEIPAIVLASSTLPSPTIAALDATVAPPPWSSGAPQSTTAQLKTPVSSTTMNTEIITRLTYDATEPTEISSAIEVETMIITPFTTTTSATTPMATKITTSMPVDVPKESPAEGEPWWRRFMNSHNFNWGVAQ
ncbi:hypothetical protein CRE_22466 [Caenorhabditis remanei]|uniref:Uncharacterized protein n=1 Tax=Caenorhabditis remanei TaxID=31234 RepID=E3MEC9_CAERE|nr:hypothetical protein CRE_22466 [Caenorhabditis remanei]